MRCKSACWRDVAVAVLVRGVAYYHKAVNKASVLLDTHEFVCSFNCDDSR